MVVNDVNSAKAFRACGEFSPALERNIRTMHRRLKGMRFTESSLELYVRVARLAALDLDKDPAEWDRKDQNRLLDSEWFRSASGGYQDTITSVLKAYWTVHERRDLLDHPTFFAPRRGKWENRGRDAKKARSLPQAEVDAVIAECRLRIREGSDAVAYRHFALLLQAAFGLRNIALTTIRACDIDAARGVVRVPLDKGRKPHAVPMDVDVSREFEIFMAARGRMVASLMGEVGEEDASFTRLKSLLAPDGHLFFSKSKAAAERGGPIDRRAIGDQNRRLMSRILGRDDVHPHMFRHSKVFHLLEDRGLDVHQVAKYVAHENIQTTYGYLDLGVEELQEALGVNGTAKAAQRQETDYMEKAARAKRMLDAGIITRERFDALIADLL